MSQESNLKPKTWHVRGLLISVFIVLAAWLSADYFSPLRDTLWLYQFFVVLTFLGLATATAFAGLTLEAIFRQLGRDWLRARKQGVPLSVLLRPVSAAVVAVLSAIVASHMLSNLLMVLNVGVISFVIFLLAPLVDKLSVQGKDRPKPIRTESPSAQDSPEDAVAAVADAAAMSGSASQSVSMAGSAAVSNVVVNVIMQKEKIIEHAATQSDPTDEEEPMQPFKENSGTGSPEDVSQRPATASSESEAVGLDQDDSPDYYQNEEIVFPDDFPVVSNKYAFRKMFVELVKAQVLDIHLQPISLPKVQIALLVNALSDMFDISKPWSTFEKFWSVSNLRQSYNQARTTRLDEDVYHALAEAEKDKRISDVIKITRWMNNYRRDNGIRT